MDCLVIRIGSLCFNINFAINSIQSLKTIFFGTFSISTDFFQSHEDGEIIGRQVIVEIEIGSTLFVIST